MRSRFVIFAIILAVVLLGTCGVLYFRLFYDQGETTPNDLTYKAVPLDAVLVQHFPHFETLGRSVAVPDGYFPILYKGGDAQGVFLRQLWQYAQAHDKELARAEVLMSLHDAGKITLTTLLCLSLAQPQTDVWWSDFLQKNRLDAPYTNYSGVRIYTLYGGASSLYVAFTHELLVASTSLVVLESSIRHLQTEGSILNNPQFARVVGDTPQTEEVQWYVSHLQIPKVLAAYGSKAMQPYASFFKTLATWTVVDGESDNHRLLLDGHAYLTNGPEDYASAFLGQGAQKLMAFDMLPANTFSAVVLSLTDFTSYMTRYDDYLVSHKKTPVAAAPSEQEWWEHLYPTEVAIAQVPFRGQMEWMAVIHTPYIGQAKTQFALLTKQEQKNVMALPDPDLLGRLFGGVFRLCRPAYYGYIGPYVVMGPQELLEETRVKYEADTYHTLAKNLAMTPVKGDLMEQANLTAFIQPSVALDTLSKALDKRYVPRVDSLARFNAQYVWFQFSAPPADAEGPLRVATHFLAYGDSLQPTPLFPKPKVVKAKDAVKQDSLHCQEPPFTVYNHFTKKDNQWVVTESMTLQMRDHSDKLLWEQPLDGPIIDGVAQIDFLKNNKVQYLFATGNQLQLLDRLGRPVSPFPKTFAQAVQYGPFLFDPKGDKDYQYLLIHEDGVLRRYQKNGNPMPGWSDYQLPAYATGAPRMLEVAKTRYWVVYTNSQTVLLTDAGETAFTCYQRECLNPAAEIEILSATQLRGTTIEGIPLLINVN